MTLLLTAVSGEIVELLRIAAGSDLREVAVGLDADDMARDLQLSGGSECW